MKQIMKRFQQRGLQTLDSLSFGKLTSRRGFQTNQRLANTTTKKPLSYLGSLLTVGVASYVIHQQYQYGRHAQAVASQYKVDEEVSHRFLQQLRQEHVTSNQSKRTLIVLYDSSNALQTEYLHEVQARNVYNRILKKYSEIEVVEIDL